ncbi:MAG TPA: HAD family phosphatase [Edaphobacter sp.]
MSQIQAILFDYGQVLSAPPDPAAWQRMRALTGLTEDLLHREYWAHRHDYDRGTLSGVAYWHKAAAGAGITLTPEQLAGLIAADTDLWTQLNAPMIAWAQKLQRAGIRTGILSNIGDAMAAGILDKFDWISAFDHCTWSYSLKLAKPEPEIYRHAAEGLRTPLADILFIDDRTENVAAALSVGMQAIQYTDHNAFEQEMRSRGLTHLLQLQGSTDSQNGPL